MDLEIRIGQHHRDWSIKADSRVLFLPKIPVLGLDDRVLTLGSCFAEMIRTRLAARHHAVLPDYSFALDQDSVRISNFVQNHLNHYHTYSIRQEFEKAAGLWCQSDEDYWTVKDHIWGTGELIFQDPYRRGIFGRDLAAVKQITKSIDEAIKRGIAQADLFLITLGLVEVWRKKDNGLVACAGPGWEDGGGRGLLSFHLSGFQDNYDNLCTTLDLIARSRPTATVVVTVSPVPLFRTMTSGCAVVANTDSKAILRSVAGQVSRERDNVHYFPSYEIALNSENPFRADGRHVRDDVADCIADAFVSAFSSEH